MARKVRKFVDREFSKTVDLDLLARLLAPFAYRLDFSWTDLPEAEREKREAIFEFFRRATESFPSALQDALHRASILSTPSGSRLLVEQADQRGIRLVPDAETEGDGDGRHLTARHLALRAYLDHRALFDRAVDLAALWSVSSPLARSGIREGVASRHEDRAACRAFADAASEYFVSRYSGRFCDVRWYPDDDEIGIRILHGRNARTANVEQEGEERTLNWREIAEDTIRYHAASGSVKVGSGNAKDAVKLLELFAEHLIGEPDFFSAAGSDDLYTLQPIREQGADFRFRHAWDDDVTGVSIKEVQVDEGEREVNGRTRYSPWSMTVRDQRDALGRLVELSPDIDFADLRITHVKLEFRFDDAGKERRVTVKLKPPNVASFLDHAFEAKIMEHLDRNGFRNPRRAQPAAAAAE